MNNNPNKNPNKEDKMKPAIIVIAILLSVIAMMNSLTNVVNVLVEQKAEEILNNYEATNKNIETLEDEKEELKGNAVGNIKIDAEKVKDDDISSIVETYKQSLVSVRNYKKVATLSSTGEYKETDELTVSSSGTGVIIGDNEKEIWIVTNHHVITDARLTEVIFANGDKANTYLKGFVSDKDIAVLSVKISDLKKDTVKKIGCAKIGDSSKIKQGQTVIALGDALHQGHSVTKGIVSLTSTPIPLANSVMTNVIQIDAPINEGDSGGALLNTKGELIGILSAKNNGEGVENIGYALPITDIKEDIEILCACEGKMQNSVTEEVYLGVTVVELPDGLLVDTIETHSPAYNSKLNVGDKIVMIDGQSVKTVSELQSELWFYKAGEIVTLRVNRPDGKDYTAYNVTVKLQRKPAETTTATTTTTDATP